MTNERAAKIAQVLEAISDFCSAKVISAVCQGDDELEELCALWQDGEISDRTFENGVAALQAEV